MLRRPISKPGIKLLGSRYKVSAKSEADYRVAKERCDDKSGNPKDICVEEAKAAQATAKLTPKEGNKRNAPGMAN
jgi:hypothetical protein